MITVYTLPQCAQCKATTRWLAKMGEPFVERDARAHADTLAEHGFMAAPVVHVTGAREDIWSGYRPDRLKAAVVGRAI